MATRQRLVQLAHQSQSVRVHARVVSASNTQTGPTRIITFSRGAYVRNITLAQERTDLVIRLRTPLSGANGRSYEVWVPAAIPAGEPAEIDIGFERGTLQGAITKQAVTRNFRVVFDGLSSALLIRGAGRVTTDEVWRMRLGQAFVLFWPVLLLAVLLGARERH